MPNDCQVELDENSSKTLVKIVKSDILYVAFIGRSCAGSEQIIDIFRSILINNGVVPFFGMEYHSLLPPELRMITPSGFVDIICLDFDHEDLNIQEKFGTDKRALNARIAREQISKLEQLGFNLNPTSKNQAETLISLLDGKITNKADFLTQLIAELYCENSWVINQLEQTFGGITQEDQRKNGFSPLKNWLYRILFRAPDGLAFTYRQTLTRELIDMIHRAGGIALYSPEEKFDDEVFNYLLDSNIDGAMGWHGATLSDLPANVIRKLRKDGKLILGGSDYDPIKDDWQPGSGKGNMYISHKRGEEFLQYLKWKRSFQA